MEENLRAKAVSGFGWRAIERYSVQGVRFFISVILARILSPHDFGLIALVAVFIALGQVLIDGGFSDALIQGEKADEALCSSVFFLNLLVGLACSTALFFIAPLVVAFYHEPELLEIVRTLSISFVLGSCGLVYNALLVRGLQFRKLAGVSFLSTLLSGAVGTALALKGFGVWSLVGQALASQFLQLLILLMVTTWRPTLRFDVAGIRTVAPFGLRVLAATVTESLFQNINVMLIGKVFTPTTLAFYARADSLWNLTMSNFSSMVSSVAFPLFARIKQEPMRLRRAMQQSVQFLAFVSFPAAIGLIVVADSLVLALLGSKWQPCIPLLQLLGGLWALYPMHALNGSVLLAQGDSSAYLRLQLLKKAVSLLSLPVVFLGIYPFVMIQVAVGLLAYHLNCSICGGALDYRTAAQFKDSLPYLACGAFMGALIEALPATPDLKAHSRLILEVGLGLLIYLAACSVLRLSALRQALDLVRERVRPMAS